MCRADRDAPYVYRYGVSTERSITFDISDD
jgi:hypothetical protein